MIGANGGAHERVYPNVVEGVVESRNDKGIKVNGEWFNISQFRRVDLPEVGTLVRISVQPKGFINSLEVIKALNGDGGSSPDREQRIARLTVLKAAASFLGEMSHTHPDVRSEHVLLVADKWLAWVNRAD